MTFVQLGNVKPEAPQGSTLLLTDNAVRKIKDFCERLLEAKGKYLRVYVQGGGCSGYSYGFKFDDKAPEDQVFEKDGAQVIIDLQSLLLINGASIDYNDGLTGAGFAVQNPNATGSCGCGSSFSV